MYPTTHAEVLYYFLVHIEFHALHMLRSGIVRCSKSFPRLAETRREDCTSTNTPSSSTAVWWAELPGVEAGSRFDLVLCPYPGGYDRAALLDEIAESAHEDIVKYSIALLCCTMEGPDIIVQCRVLVV